MAADHPDSVTAGDKLMINLSLNGNAYSLLQGSTVQELIKELDLAGQAVTVTVNQRMLPRRGWPRVLQADDRVNIAYSSPSVCSTISRD